MTDSIVVQREVIAPRCSTVTPQDVLTKYAELMPQLEELHRMALELREDFHEALMALHRAGHDLCDATYGAAEAATGWGDVWDQLSRIGDLFSGSDGDFAVVGMSNVELRRGEPSYPPGTVAAVTDPDGRPCRVEVMFVPTGSSDQYLVADLADPVHKHYGCSHDELKAGLESEPDEAGQAAALERHVQWRMAAMATTS